MISDGVNLIDTLILFFKFLIKILDTDFSWLVRKQIFNLQETKSLIFFSFFDNEIVKFFDILNAKFYLVELEIKESIQKHRLKVLCQPFCMLAIPGGLQS